MNYLVFLMAFAGIVLHLLVKYQDSRSKKEMFAWKDHLVYAAMSAIAMVAIIVGWEQAKVYLGMGDELFPFTAFLLGYFSDSMIKNISKFNPIRIKK
jgi:cell division protein FtsW (lipid II flippase)